MVFYFLTSAQYLFAYDRVKAVNYANQYWGSSTSNGAGYNYPIYWDYAHADKNPLGDEGGDCANFVSQCLIAGGIRFDSSQGYMGIGDTIIRAADMPGALTKGDIKSC